MRYTRLVPARLLARAEAKAPRRAWHRVRAIPATRLPSQKKRRAGTIISIAFHLLLLYFLVGDPPMKLDPNLVLIEQGGGGPGPAGGGGGGTRGTGGVKYVQLQTPPPAVTPPPVTPPLPVLEPPKPVVPEPVLPQLEMPKLAEPSKVEVKTQSAIVGNGGGTGNDGTAGNGSGTGGGVGSGIGTGRGSGVGPGTGGGKLNFFGATLIEMPIPPLPKPAKVLGTKVIIDFYLDERGKIDSVVFTPTRDGGYNKKLNDLFHTFKFRPATTFEGVAMKSKYQMSYDL